MSELQPSQEIDPRQSILMPEVGSRAVQAFQVMNQEAGLPVLFQDMPLGEALDMLVAREVGAVLAGASYTTGEVIVQGINKFNPRRNEAGEEDPKGQRQLVSSFFLFERGSDTPFIIADCAVNENPEILELLQIAEQTVDNARKLDIEPRVAFLSYSTIGSGHGRSSAKIRDAAKLFKDKYPDIPAIGEVQFDAATDEEIYKKKTDGHNYPGNAPPNIFIAPSLDTGNTIYKVLQSPHFGGGWTAVGPLLQGFEGGHQLHDLSRGVKPATLEVICRYVAKLSGLPLLDMREPQPQQ
jgi:phosphotransacetylase